MEFLCSSFGQFVPKDKTVCIPTRPGFPGTSQNGGHYDYFCDSDKTLCTSVASATVNFTVYLDEYPWELGAMLYSSNTGVNIWENLVDTLLPEPGAAVTVSEILPPGSYYLLVFDSNGDGLSSCYNHLCGSEHGFTIEQEGAIIYTGTRNYGYYYEVVFEVSDVGDVSVVYSYHDMPMDEGDDDYFSYDDYWEDDDDYSPDDDSDDDYSSDDDGENDDWEDDDDYFSDDDSDDDYSPGDDGENDDSDDYSGSGPGMGPYSNTPRSGLASEKQAHPNRPARPSRATDLINELKKQPRVKKPSKPKRKSSPNIVKTHVAEPEVEPEVAEPKVVEPKVVKVVRVQNDAPPTKAAETAARYDKAWAAAAEKP